MKRTKKTGYANVVIEPVEVGKRLAELRYKTGLSQRSFAEEMQIAKSSVADYETGKKLISTYVLDMYVRYFDISPCWILYGRTPEEIKRCEVNAKSADEYDGGQEYDNKETNSKRGGLNHTKMGQLLKELRKNDTEHKKGARIYSQGNLASDFQDLINRFAEESKIDRKTTIDSKTISEYEHGRRITLDVLNLYVVHFHCSLDSIWSSCNQSMDQKECKK